MHHFTHVFKTGNSLAIRIPKAFHLTEQQEVELILKGNELIVRIMPTNLADALLALPPFPDDISIDEIEDSPPQKREF
jgi:antitoxin VapB